VAYPFVALGFVFTLLFAALFLHEPVTSTKLAGTALVILGVILLNR